MTEYRPLSARQFKGRLRQIGLSQRKFAFWFGFDVGTVNRWARGRSTIPQYVAVIMEILLDAPEIVARRISA